MAGQGVVPISIPATDRIALQYAMPEGIELDVLVGSFIGVGHLFEQNSERMAIRHGLKEPTPHKLYVTRLETGSLLVDLAPYVPLLGTAVQWIDSYMVVKDFTFHLAYIIRRFADAQTEDEGNGKPSAALRPDTAEQVKALLQPLKGKDGASLRIQHARFKIATKEEVVEAEYSFSAPEIDRAVEGAQFVLDNQAQLTQSLSVLEQQPSIEEITVTSERETPMYLSRTDAAWGAAGRTPERAIVPAISSKPLPVRFKSSVQHVRDSVLKGEVHPYTNALIVDVDVQRTAGEPKSYFVTHYHGLLPNG